jgi:hypothetical protein
VLNSRAAVNKVVVNRMIVIVTNKAEANKVVAASRVAAKSAIAIVRNKVAANKVANPAAVSKAVDDKSWAFV